MSEILDKAKSHGVEIDKVFNRIAELQELRKEAEYERAYLEQEGESTLLQDEIIERIMDETAKEEQKLKEFRSKRKNANK